LEQQNQKPLLLLNVGTEAQGQVQPKLAKTTSTDIPCLPNFKFLTGKKRTKGDNKLHIYSIRLGQSTKGQ
jgi:hypothetical protein